MQGCVFRKLRADEVPQMFSMILARMRWMDENGIRQWNATEYDRAYPLEYYMDEQYRGRIFALASVPADEIACAAILKEEDERWTDDAPALYIHNFVSGIGAGGAGARFIESAGEYARRLGKEYLRLDSAENNAAPLRLLRKTGLFARRRMHRRPLSRRSAAEKNSMTLQKGRLLKCGACPFVCRKNRRAREGQSPLEL